MVSSMTGKIQRLLMLISVIFTVSVTSSYAGVVSGSFVYKQEESGDLIQYQVAAVDFQGIEAWRISWDCAQLKAEHYVRRNDGKPLYAKRVNHALKRTIEVIYAQNPGETTIYRKRSESEFLERKIKADALRDLGALPQLLVSDLAVRDKPDTIKFQAINYDDGKVYDLRADPSGFRYVDADNKSVRCVAYEIKLDSWMAALIGKTRLLVPADQNESNFMAYSGPGLDSVSDKWSLTLIGRDTKVAMATSLLSSH